MNSITTKAMAKVAAVAAGLAMATSMLSLAPIAHAACSVGTVDLTVGSTGSAVTCLQQNLIAAGYSIPAGATGYFGAQTKAAVSSWQAAAGVSPAAGYFGPISRAAWSNSTSMGGGTSTVAGCAAGAMFSSTTGASCTSTSTVAGCAPGAMFSSTTGQSCGTSTTTTLPAGCTSTAGFSPTTGVSCSTGVTTTTGGTGVGYLTQVTSLGDITSSLNAGNPAVNVVGFSAHATNGNVTVQRVQALFTICGGTVLTTYPSGASGTASFCSNGVDNQSVNLNRYVSDISLWDGSTEIADVNPSTAGSFTGRTWTILFPGLSAVIPANTTANFHIQVTPLASVGTTETGQPIVVSIPLNGINAVGSDGIQGTYGPGIDQQFTVSTANVGTLTVSTASDNPNASLVAVGSSTTTGVKLLAFNLQAKNQPLTVTQLNASVGVNAGSVNVNNVLNTLYLEDSSGNVIASKTGSSGTYNAINFQNLNVTIPEGTTAEYWLVADIKGDQSYSDGATIVASTSASGWTVTDANGATVNPSSAALGNTQTLSAAGISVALGTPTATDVSTTISGQGDTGNYSIPFTVTAGSSDIWVSGVVGASGVATAGDINFATTSTSNIAVTNQGVANLSVQPQVGGSTSGDVTSPASSIAYKVPANTARTFTLNVTYTATATGYTGLQLVSIYYGTSAAQAVSTGASLYNSNITTFQTNNINLVKH
jgi:hypothetical protein